MAANSDGSHHDSNALATTTILTCEGELSDPGFPVKLREIVGRLNGILGGDDVVKVRKLEPWNSVRVTLSIPPEAALRLRQLANEGSQQLRALGILSVQVEGDQVISLRLAAPAGSVGDDGSLQEIVLRTSAQDGPSADRQPQETDLGLSRFLSPAAAGSSGSIASTSSAPIAAGGATASSSSAASPMVVATAATASTIGGAASAVAAAQVQFKSPNVVCPPDSVVPKVGNNSNSQTNVNVNGKTFAGPPFPFTSMNQAIHSNRDAGPAPPPPPPPFNSLPPPYPGKHPPVTLSSPLLVNLLQNDGKDQNVAKLQQQQQQQVNVRSMIRTPPAVQSVQKTVTASTVPVSVNHALSQSLVKQQQQHHGNQPLTTTQANVLVNNTNNNSNSHILSPPSALSQNTTTSIRQNTNNNSNSTILTSTTAVTMAGPPVAGPAVAVVTNNNIVPVPQTAPVQPSQQLPPPPPPQYHRPTQIHTGISVQQSGMNISSLTSPLIPPPQQQAQPVNSNVPLTQQASYTTLSQQHHHQPPQQQQSMQMQAVSNNIPVSQQSSIPKVPPPPPPKMNNVVPLNPQHTQQTHLQSVYMPAAPLTQQSQQQQQPMQPVVSATPVATTAPQSNILTRSLPSPPPYSVAISHTWDNLVHSTPLMDLTPTLTDLKPDDLDELLPAFERDLSNSPLPDIPEDFLTNHSTNQVLNSINLGNAVDSIGIGLGPSMSVPAPQPPTIAASNLATSLSGPSSSSIRESDKRKFLINPLTGELEPHVSEGESDNEQNDVFTGLPSPVRMSDDDTNSTNRPDTATDQSDSETRSEGSKHNRVKKVRDRGRDSPSLKPTEKIKLRLKLEKSENNPYKVDVSFINTQPKKASASVVSASGNSSNNMNSTPSAPGEELRVPPLHISLRGRNSAVIKNKSKLNSDGSPVKTKIRKNQDYIKAKKEETDLNNDKPTLEQKKFKKFKPNHKVNPQSEEMGEYLNHYKDKQKERRGSDSELIKNNKRYLDTNGVAADEKKRRLSQSEAAEKPTTPEVSESTSLVVGSTNVGTIIMPSKPRKDKLKTKDGIKSSKEANRNKAYHKLTEKLIGKQVTLPTAGEIDMEAKFKQSLLEGSAEKGILRPPHRTEIVNHLTTENNRIPDIKPRAEKVNNSATPTAATVVKEKSPEPNKCNTPDRKSVVEMGEKQPATTGSRSPNSGSSGGQGEDSGIESMDALSEKSPNQASQSPHADLVQANNKTQVPDMLDIEAQLAKMEGLSSETDGGGEGSANNVAATAVSDGSGTNNAEEKHSEESNGNKGIEEQVTNSSKSSSSSSNKNIDEDVNENNKHHTDETAKLKQCCELTCALQDNLKQSAATLESRHTSPPAATVVQQADISLVPLKVKKEENLEPIPVRVTPALYTYSNPEKSIRNTESPTITDEDSNSCSNTTNNSTTSNLSSQTTNTSTTATTTSTTTNAKSKSLLEQLLIEIPNDHQGVPSSPSPATRSSIRTRALSSNKSGGLQQELPSPVAKNLRNQAAATAPAPAKRKRNESDSSNQSVDETGLVTANSVSSGGQTRNKKARKGVETPTAELLKPAAKTTETLKVNNVNKKQNKLQQDESSDSDEPLSEKLRKTPITTNTNNSTSNNVAKNNKMKGGSGGAIAATTANNNKSVVSTRRSVRSAMPAQNTRSKGDTAKIQEAEAIRRKTRSADVENKRKKELK